MADKGLQDHQYPKVIDEFSRLVIEAKHAATIFTRRFDASKFILSSQYLAQHLIPYVSANITSLPNEQVARFLEALDTVPFPKVHSHHYGPLYDAVVTTLTARGRKAINENDGRNLLSVAAVALRNLPTLIDAKEAVDNLFAHQSIQRLLVSYSFNKIVADKLATLGFPYYLRVALLEKIRQIRGDSSAPSTFIEHSMRKGRQVVHKSAFKKLRRQKESGPVNVDVERISYTKDFWTRAEAGEIVSLGILGHELDSLLEVNSLSVSDGPRVKALIQSVLSKRYELSLDSRQVEAYGPRAIGRIAHAISCILEKNEFLDVMQQFDLSVFGLSFNFSAIKLLEQAYATYELPAPIHPTLLHAACAEMTLRRKATNHESKIAIVLYQAGYDRLAIGAMVGPYEVDLLLFNKSGEPVCIEIQGIASHNQIGGRSRDTEDKKLAFLRRHAHVIEVYFDEYMTDPLRYLGSTISIISEELNDPEIKAQFERLATTDARLLEQLACKLRGEFLPKHSSLMNNFFRLRKYSD